MPVEVIKQMPSAAITRDINRDRDSSISLGAFHIDTASVAVGADCKQNGIDVLVF
jgi:hypothetical protein